MVDHRHDPLAPSLEPQRRRRHFELEPAVVAHGDLKLLAGGQVQCIADRFGEAFDLPSGLPLI